MKPDKEKTKDFSAKEYYRRFRIQIAYVVAAVVLFVLLLLFIAIKIGLFDKKPVVEIVPDNTYTETLYVVTDNDYKPYSFYDEKGNASGYDVELVADLANQLHMNLDLKLTSWQEGINAVTRGEADLLMTCGYSDEFKGVEKLIMSEMTSIDDYVVYSKNPVNSISAMFGKRIAIMKGGNAMPKMEMLGLYEYCKEYKDNKSAMQALARGDADVAVMRQAIGDGILEDFPSSGIHAYITCGQSYMCYGIAGKNKELATKINHVIEGFKKDGTIERLSDKWLTTFVRPYTFKEVVAHNQWVLLIIFLLLVYIVFNSFRQTRQKFKQHEIQAAKDRDMQEKLQQALQMAQTANKAKTTFLNSMSHDIRTPMNAIVGYTNLAVTHLDNTVLVKDYLGKITQSSAHLLSLINDVLDMSRIESGKMHLEEREENMSEIIHTLKDIVQADINKKHLEFYVDALDVNNEYVICDKLRLNQVLLNILSNSIKYTPSGGAITMHIKEKALIETGVGEFEFVIKDTGMGMSSDFLETIFEPFARERSTTVSKIQGTGLGMAITKNIIDMMGGTINIKSELGKGTEVRMYFSFKLQQDPELLAEMPKLSGVKALVVDDDINSCLAVSRMLKELDMRVEWCTSGKEAVVRAKEAARGGDSFQIYLLDCLIPDLNGMEVARRIRKALGDEVPIVFLTAYDLSFIEDEAREAGVNAYVPKPVFPSDLHRGLAHCFQSNNALPIEEEEEINLQGAKILMVEDNEMNREIMTIILEEFGCEVFTADDGEIAVEKMRKAKEGDYDLILMDIQMPKMDGYQATRAIRELERSTPTLLHKEGAKVSPLRGDAEGSSMGSTRHIPIFAMTANAFEEDKRAALQAGMDEHIAKPIDRLLLKEMLAKYINKK